jgi:hypothetical protein
MHLLYGFLRDSSFGGHPSCCRGSARGNTEGHTHRSWIACFDITGRRIVSAAPFVYELKTD